MVGKMRIKFVMLMALLLPLHGYAAMPACQEQVRADVGAATAAAPSATQHDCTPTAPAHQHNCGQCCCGVGIALTPSLFIAPYFAAAEITPTGIVAPPQGALERLDRPPRFILT